MKRRVTTSAKVSRADRGKTANPKRRAAAAVAGRQRSSDADLQEQVRALTRELTEAREEQTATSEVLNIISSSPGELEPVFQAMLENAIRICHAKCGTIYRYDGEMLHRVAGAGTPPALVEYQRQRGVFRPKDDSFFGRFLKAKAVAHLADDAASPIPTAATKFGGARSILAVPMLKDDTIVGLITMYRQEVHPFTEKQIELVQNFAAQAVIAIENTRLLNELRRRTDDLSESLAQQTATSEVLKVISSSPGNLEPVFETMLSNMCHICDAQFSGLLLREGDAFRRVALHGAPPAYADLWHRERVIRRGVGTLPDQTVKTKQAIHVVGLQRDQSPALFELAGARTVLSVPLIKDNEVVGVISIYRQELRQFTDKQIDLVQNFAAQAVIAIENTRLLNELRQRTDDLTESLEQQTATSEVLKVISGSLGEAEPVFRAMLANAVRLCGSSYGALWLREDDAFRTAAFYGDLPEAYTGAEQWRIGALYRPPPDIPIAQATRNRRPAQVTDIRETRAYREGHPLHVSAADVAGILAVLAVPMLKNNEPVGAIVIYRKEAGPFHDKQIELVQNFAAQAVIAIENTRLLNELRESLQQQTATADVLKVISRSTFDLQTVLDALVQSAARLCEADGVAINQPKEGALVVAASIGHPEEFIKAVREIRFVPGRATITGRVLLEGKPVQIADALADPEYRFTEAREITGFRTTLAVPLLREGDTIGVMVLTRREVRPFTDKQVELVTTFADQAVIAIENVRLFDEIQDKSRQLAEASQHKSQFLANMSHELRTPLNAILGYTELIADGIYGAPPEKMQAVLKRVESNGKHLLGLINAVLDLSKIEAGQLVLDLADYSLGNVANTVYGAVEPLAADKKLAFKAEVAPNLPPGRGDERRLTQVLLNLVGNAIKFTDAGEVTVKVAAVDGSFSVAVHDTGPGISPVDQAKLFQEFQQADNSIARKKEGTGLGLAISKRIIEMHGGRIWVESVVGQGSTFAFTLPVQVEKQIKVE